MRVFNAAQMREADRRTIEDVGIPSIVLMENAGHQVVEAMRETFDDLERQRVAVLCGRGNNGGDGCVIARRLLQHDVEVQVFLLGRQSDVRGDARANLDALTELGVAVVEVTDAAGWEQHGPAVLGHDLVVDALLGTGLSKPLEGLIQRVVRDLNGAAVPVVAVDLPTGLSADVHHPIGDRVEAELTVTFATPKLPLVLAPGDAAVGTLVVADIGIPETVVDSVDGPRISVLTPDSVADWIPTRDPGSHKGDHGHVLVVAGSIGKTGAACLAGLGALQSGAGLVTVATPRSCQPVVAVGAPEYMTVPLADADGCVAATALDEVLQLPCDVLAIGPGLGTGAGAASLVHGIIERATVPVVLDADALNILSAGSGWSGGPAGSDLVLTPHPGEMARLCGLSTAQVQADRIEAARAFATSRRVHLVLKGAQTLVATPDGAVFINMTGNPGMATGGMGDVLTGVTAAWLAQLGETERACKIAVHVHGLAGDLAAAATGEIGLTASVLAAALPRAIHDTANPTHDPPDSP